MSHEVTSVDVADLPLLGRAEEGNASPTLHVFGQIATDATDVPGTLTDARASVQGAGKLAGGTQFSKLRMRRIRSSATEVVRSAAQAVSPLGRNEIRPPGAGLDRCANYHLIVALSTPEGNTEFRMDVGQTLDMLCGAVNFQVAGGGSDSYLVGQTAQPDAQLEGLVADALIKPVVTCIESAEGDRSQVTFSELVRIPTATQLPIPVPAFAIACKVLMADGTSTDWSTFAGLDAGAGLSPEGIIVFDANGQYSLDETAPLGQAQYLLTDQTGQGDRIAKLIWTIRP